MQIVLLCGGLGSRLKEIDNLNPKEREYQESDSKRFHIIKASNYGMGYKPLLETDNFFEVLECRPFDQTFILVVV